MTDQDNRESHIRDHLDDEDDRHQDRYDPDSLGMQQSRHYHAAAELDCALGTETENGREQVASEARACELAHSQLYPCRRLVLQNPIRRVSGIVPSGIRLMGKFAGGEKRGVIETQWSEAGAATGQPHAALGRLLLQINPLHISDIQGNANAVEAEEARDVSEAPLDCATLGHDACIEQQSLKLQRTAHVVRTQDSKAVAGGHSCKSPGSEKIYMAIAAQASLSTTEHPEHECVIARRFNNKPAARIQYAMHLIKDQSRVWYVFDHVDHRDHVNGSGLQVCVKQRALQYSQLKLLLCKQAQAGVRLDTNGLPAVFPEEVQQATQAAADLHKCPTRREILGEKFPRVAIVANLPGFLFHPPLVSCHGVIQHPGRIVCPDEVDVGGALVRVCVHEPAIVTSDDPVYLRNACLEQH